MDAVLFGNILGVTLADVWVVVGVSLFTVDVVIARYRALLMLVLAVSILATMKVIGVVLLAATLVIPPVCARMLTSSFARMLWLSTMIGAACGFVGMYLSYHLDVSSGATIALVGAALFCIVFSVTASSSGAGRLARPTSGGSSAVASLPIE